MDKNLSEEKPLTVKEVANILDETPNVIRNWVKDLKHYIPLQKNASGYNVFDAAALERMKLIRELHRDRNYSIKQIEHYFATNGESYKPEPIKGPDVLLAEELKSIREELQSLKEQNVQQEKFNKALITKLDEQQKYIDERLNARDEALLHSLRESMETRLQIATAQEEKKRGFFARLFSK
ncbi:MerR family transcriptional regulator [Alkalihalobacterium alkalinitrilicum]|uniref:MerR family transcriptional regulator n=1 Tax=Alkalihalobacterium alkalinitrilicum TaxID=427920 RepID=UPI000994EAFF|nr:MerR family transcriptional regulator [Alkalihalobacterium alkalinitrilicum]